MYSGRPYRLFNAFGLVVLYHTLNSTYEIDCKSHTRFGDNALAYPSLFVVERFRMVQVSFPGSTALQRFDFSEFVFSDRRKELPAPNLVIVNVGELDHREIARQIRILNRF